MEVKEKNNLKFDINKFVEMPDFESLHGRGGNFLVTPLDSYKVFSQRSY